MKIKSTLIKFIISAATIFLFLPLIGVSQHIKLKDVAKFEFNYHEGGMGRGYRRFEVAPDSGIWKCYQIDRSYTDLKKGNVRQNWPIFAGNVEPNLLKQLLKIMAKKDTGINPRPFHINKNELVKNIDSLKIKFTEAQRSRFVKTIDSQLIVNQMLRKAIIGFPMADKSHYGIIVTTKTNTIVKLDAYSFANLYNLPWNFSGIQCYDPNITLIYETIAGHVDYASKEHKRLHNYIDAYMYRRYLKAGFEAIAVN